jgi:hypothetical protein
MTDHTETMRSQLAGFEKLDMGRVRRPSGGGALSRVCVETPKNLLSG